MNKKDINKVKELNALNKKRRCTWNKRRFLFKIPRTIWCLENRNPF